MLDFRSISDNYYMTTFCFNTKIYQSSKKGSLQKTIDILCAQSEFKTNENLFLIILQFSIYILIVSFIIYVHLSYMCTFQKKNLFTPDKNKNTVVEIYVELYMRKSHIPKVFI